MFAKLATAKNREKLDLLTYCSSSAICQTTTMKKGGMVKRVHIEWDLNL